MAMSYKEAYRKAAEYLALCSGYPKNVKVNLYKTEQKFNNRKNCQEIIFTMYVRQPPMVDMDAPLSESTDAWGLIQQANHEVILVEQGRAIRFFQADFNRFAKLLLKELGYSSKYKFSIPAVSHSKDMKGQRDIYNIRLHIEKPIKIPDIAYEAHGAH